MDNRKEFIERRKHHRFKVKRGAVAAVIKTSSVKEEQAEGSIATAPKNIQMGQIINISKGGLAFCCIDDEDKLNELNELFELDILFSQKKIYLKNIPFKTVWVSPAVSMYSFSPLKTNQRGEQFGEMTPHQMSELDNFLQEYTIR